MIQRSMLSGLINNWKWVKKQPLSKKKTIFKRPSKNPENQSIPFFKINYKTDSLEAKTKDMRGSSGLLHSTACTRAFCKHLIRCWYSSSASEGTCCMTFHSLQATHPPTWCNSHTNVLDYIEKWFVFLELNGWRWTDWFSLGFIIIFI